MREVRDRAITEWEMILDGRMKGPGAVRVRDSLATFGAEQMDAIRNLIPEIVDTTLDHLLLTLEEEKTVDVLVHAESGGVSNIRDVSDGLSGELPDWIPRFSKKRYIPPV